MRSEELGIGFMPFSDFAFFLIPNLIHGGKYENNEIGMSGGTIADSYNWNHGSVGGYNTYNGGRVL
jgi:hypothetical protein